MSVEAVLSRISQLQAMLDTSSALPIMCVAPAGVASAEAVRPPRNSAPAPTNINALNVIGLSLKIAHDKRPRQLHQLYAKVV